MYLTLKQRKSLKTSSRFYGITLDQIWFYFRTYTADALFMRILVSMTFLEAILLLILGQVGILWVLDTVQLVLVVQSLYMYAVIWRGDVNAIGGVSMYVLLPHFQMSSR